MSYTSSAIKDKGFDKLVSVTKDTEQVSDELDKFLENCVYKDKRPAFKLLREIEKTNFNLEIANKIANKVRDYEIEKTKLNLEIANKIAKLNLEIVNKDKELAVASIKTVSCA